MRKLAKFLKIFMLILILFFLSSWWYLNSLKPDYEGSKTIADLTKETQVYFDDFGIPHIFASSKKDAMTALGYVHAQDRLWQMELMRRIAPGRLAEILGAEMIDS